MNKADNKSEGVLVAKKDYNLPKHGEIDTKNLFVCEEEVNSDLISPGHQGLPVPNFPRLC
jgi:hypothetical protein